MRFLLSGLKWLLAVLLVAVLGLALWLVVAPPAVIRVASGYAAKIVCSNVHIAGRDAGDVMTNDVQAPGHWLLRYMAVDNDPEARTTRVALLGLFGRSVAVARDGLGCVSLPGGATAQSAALAPLSPASASAELPWPGGNAAPLATDPLVAAILDDPALTGPGMRAVVVVRDGQLVAERYASGFDASTPLLGWSMTKSVTAGLIGTLVGAGRMDVAATNLFEAWEADERARISVADLMSMSSGLEFNEDYGDVTDVTRMLFLEPDMTEFAADKPLRAPAGEAFSYSSGTTVLLSALWQEAAGGGEAALAWPRLALFDPIGMSSAVLETDAAGTYVGSSFLYATARDWARYGLLLLDDGVWNGNRILPEGYVSWMSEPAPASNGLYGRGQVWMQGPGDDEAGEVALGIPADAFWMLGHDGQSIAVIPSADMVVVRLGLTPSGLGYRPEPMVGALVKALAGT
ncbi:serine hydrolase domain-containing protein [Devosia sediminis]|uniref:Serine hydrolase n=1 Tax=Devosia sediminis TaxID=2798801 RepID=A0A934MMA5_9HYPH|nr:serine hydrolase [Devosia sediminis]MBJ3785506.1 serine hydrolase [Devosia sediminis]